MIVTASRTLLVGNAFPLTLLRRPVRIEPRSRSEWSAALSDHDKIQSFWGHANTLSEASAWAGIDLAPDAQRPALVLDGQRYPSLNGQSFSRCWVLSPDYASGFRPQEGQIVPPEAILGWQALEIIWE